MISVVKSSSSTFPCGLLRWVERCWLITRQLRRSLAPRVCRTCITAIRWRARLSTFPKSLPSGWAYPKSNLKPLCAVVDFPSRLPSDASTDGWPCHAIPFANDSISLRLHRSDVLHLLLPSPDSEIPQPFWVWSRFLPVCIFTWPFEPSFQKLYRFNFPYYKVDHFLAGGPTLSKCM